MGDTPQLSLRSQVASGLLGIARNGVGLPTCPHGSNQRATEHLADSEAIDAKIKTSGLQITAWAKASGTELDRPLRDRADDGSILGRSGRGRPVHDQGPLRLLTTGRLQSTPLRAVRSATACHGPGTADSTRRTSARRALRWSSGRRLDRGDVDLRHRHHRLHSPLCRGHVRTVHRLQQCSRRDLPGEPPPVSAPATRAFLPAVVDDRVPIPVGLGLVVGQHHEADGLVRNEVRSTVETYE